jgi:hypothetical protein
MSISRTPIGGKFASNPGLGNRAMAEFFVDLARMNLRAAQNDIARAERESPGSTGFANVSVMRALLALEAQCPEAQRRSDEEE